MLQQQRKMGSSRLLNHVQVLRLLHPAQGSSTSQTVCLTSMYNGTIIILLPPQKRKPRVNKPCKHCGINMGSHARGLCYRCWSNPTIKDLYPADRRCNRGVSCTNTNITRAMPTPTTALPGTEEKFEVLCQRAERGEQLFHPLDATHEEDGWKMDHGN
jgi:hypothetical protein